MQRKKQGICVKLKFSFTHVGGSPYSLFFSLHILFRASLSWAVKKENCYTSNHEGKLSSVLCCGTVYKCSWWQNGLKLRFQSLTCVSQIVSTELENIKPGKKNIEACVGTFYAGDKEEWPQLKLLFQFFVRKHAFSLASISSYCLLYCSLPSLLASQPDWGCGWSGGEKENHKRRSEYDPSSPTASGWSDQFYNSFRSTKFKFLQRFYSKCRRAE